MLESLFNKVAGLQVVLAWLRAWRAWRAYVPGVLVCLHVSVLGVLVSVRACYDEMFYFLTCLRTWCNFFSYLLYISIPKSKNSYSEKFVCFIKLNIFPIYILIPTHKTF